MHDTNKRISNDEKLNGTDLDDGYRRQHIYFTSLDWLNEDVWDNEEIKNKNLYPSEETDEESVRFLINTIYEYDKLLSDYEKAKEEYLEVEKRTREFFKEFGYDIPKYKGAYTDYTDKVYWKFWNRKINQEIVEYGGRGFNSSAGGYIKIAEDIYMDRAGVWILLNDYPQYKKYVKEKRTRYGIEYVSVKEGEPYECEKLDDEKLFDDLKAHVLEEDAAFTKIHKMETKVREYEYFLFGTPSDVRMAHSSRHALTRSDYKFIDDYMFYELPF